MQGLRPLFLSGVGLLRSKLRQTGTGKKQPSFLRLASRQGKQEKQLSPRFLLSQRKVPTVLEIGDVFTIPEDCDFLLSQRKAPTGLNSQ